MFIAIREVGFIVELVNKFVLSESDNLWIDVLLCREAHERKSVPKEGSSCGVVSFQVGVAHGTYRNKKPYVAQQPSYAAPLVVD